MDQEFRFEVEMTVRYRDMDALAHVNNAVYSSYIEQARIEYVEEVIDMTFDEWEMVLANIDLDFRRPVVHADEYVRVEVGVTEVGESSFSLGYRVYAGDDEKPAATGTTVQVVLDENGESTQPVPEAWRERFREFEPGL
ncbi:acyl-CoA thioesterase [Natronomonas sp.]|uniref:acyl-CoA thioesterase n=1 Tax=Natronomonas sp. TaxID=2184060 RepID=UPI002FC28326